MKVNMLTRWKYAPEPGVTIDYQPGEQDMPDAHAHRAMRAGVAEPIKPAAPKPAPAKPRKKLKPRKAKS